MTQFRFGHYFRKTVSINLIKPKKKKKNIANRFNVQHLYYLIVIFTCEIVLNPLFRDPAHRSIVFWTF